MKIIVALLALAASFTLCEQGYSMEGMGFDYEDVINTFDYNPSTVTTVRGRITGIDTHSKTTGMGNAVVLVIQTQEGEMQVVLAPEWYIENQKFELKENQYVTILGSQIEKDNKHFFIAAELGYNDQVLKLRDSKSGKPEWSEWRKNEGIFYKNYIRE